MLRLHVNSRRVTLRLCFFFFNDTATTEIYTLSLHDALPIFHPARRQLGRAHRALDRPQPAHPVRQLRARRGLRDGRSEEHTSELQSRQYLVCRLLLEKKNITQHHKHIAWHNSLSVSLSRFRS